MTGLTCEAVADRDLVARYVTDRLDLDALEAFEAHLLMCDRCQDDVRLAMALREAFPAQAADAGDLVPEEPTRRRFPLAAVGTGLAAAAALLLVLVLPRAVNPPGAPPEHRAPSVGDTPAELTPLPLSPVGEVERVSALVWSHVDGANRYRATLLDENGNVVWESETPDTVATIPPDRSLTGGVTYFWKVDARFGFGRWLESGVAEFRLLPTPDAAQPPDDLPDASQQPDRPPD